MVITWIVFGQTLSHEFVNYDDPAYVYQNAIVRSGLTFSGLSWAFTHPHARNWHPLTTISHMVDCQFFWVNAGAHHTTNVVLHMLAAALLFLLLNRVTDSIWSSAFVAALFAVHPLHVESVAWIAERKDVLSAVFFMLTLGAYVSYAQKPSTGRYLRMAILFACGLMAKPMLVTVPFVLLLLDYWPLSRYQMSDIRGQRSAEERRSPRQTFVALIIEKIPLLALSLICGLVTFLIQERSAGSIEQLPLVWRLNNAVVSYVIYLAQMSWPADLAVFYPHPENHLALWQTGLSLALLLSITGLAVAWRSTRPYLFVGWLWYLVMLLPVIGIVQVGLQGHADRYTYLPQIGLYIAITWLVVDLCRALPYRRTILAPSAAMIVLMFTACAWKQASYWRNSESLWTRALAVTSDNDVAHTNLALVFLGRRQPDEAISHLQTALAIRSGTGHAHYNLSRALIHTDLGNAFAAKGQAEEAMRHFEEAIALQPEYPDAHYNLGKMLSQQGRLDEAIAQWEKSVSLRPDDAEAHSSLGTAFLQKGALREAMNHYEKAVTGPAPSIFAFNNLAWILSTCPDASMRNGPRAIALERRAVELLGDETSTFLRTFGAAYAETGEFDAAIEVASRALDWARSEKDVDLAREIEKDLELYRAKSPMRDLNLKNAP